MYCSKEAGFAESPMGQEMVRQTPLGRLGRPDDIAAVVGFLASDEACWVTGQVIQTVSTRSAIMTQFFWALSGFQVSLIISHSGAC